MKYDHDEFRRLLLIGKAWGTVTRILDNACFLSAPTRQNWIDWLQEKDGDEIAARLTILNKGYKEIDSLFNEVVPLPDEEE